MTSNNNLLKNHKQETPYQAIAKRFSISVKYVGIIARQERGVPKRGKGLEVYNYIKSLSEKEC